MTTAPIIPERKHRTVKVLVVGESWTTFSTHVKGIDSFTTSTYGEGIEPLRSELEIHGHEVVHLPSQQVAEGFPFTAEGLAEYQVIMVSDVGANSFYLSHRTFKLTQAVPDRLQLLHDWAYAGGGLVMIGGYLSFSGIEGKAAFGTSPLAPCLPVILSGNDDRAERPAGVLGQVVLDSHPLAADVAGEWPPLLGYNRVTARPEADVVATVDGADPLLVTWSYGSGRVTAYMSDCAPHWAPSVFLEWKHYSTLWNNIVEWTGSSTVAAAPPS